MDVALEYGDNMSQVAYMADQFGHISQLAQILKGNEMKNSTALLVTHMVVAGFSIHNIIFARGLPSHILCAYSCSCYC